MSDGCSIVPLSTMQDAPVVTTSLAGFFDSSPGYSHTLASISHSLWRCPHWTNLCRLLASDPILVHDIEILRAHQCTLTIHTSSDSHYLSTDLAAHSMPLLRVIDALVELEEPVSRIHPAFRRKKLRTSGTRHRRSGRNRAVGVFRTSLPRQRP